VDEGYSKPQDLTGTGTLAIRCLRPAIVAARFVGVLVRMASVTVVAPHGAYPLRSHPALASVRSVWQREFPDAFVEVALFADSQATECDVGLSLLDLEGHQQIVRVRAIQSDHFVRPALIVVEPKQEPAGTVRVVLPGDFADLPVRIVIVPIDPRTGHPRKGIECRHDEPVVLPAGTHEVRIDDGSWFGVFFDKKRIDLRDGANQTIALEAKERCHRIRFRVSVPPGDPMPGAAVTSSRNGKGYSGCLCRLTDPLDVYLPPGEFGIRIRTKRYREVFLPVVVDEAAAARAPYAELRLERSDNE
jgi:hypothetical protein